jgi:hypothetical protein
MEKPKDADGDRFPKDFMERVKQLELTEQIARLTLKLETQAAAAQSLDDLREAAKRILQILGSP